MAYAYVQSGNPGSGSLTTYTLAQPACAAGAALILGVAFASNNRSIVSVSDNIDGAWTVPVQGGVASSGMGAAYKLNCSASARTITVVFDSSTVSGVFLDCDEYSGILTASALDQASALAITASAASVSTASVTTTQANELLWTFGRSEGAGRPLTTPAGFTARSSLDTTRFVTADNRQTVAGGESVTWAVTGGNSAIGGLLLTFKEAGGASLTDDDAGWMPKAAQLDSIVSVW